MPDQINIEIDPTAKRKVRRLRDEEKHPCAMCKNKPVQPAGFELSGKGYAGVFVCSTTCMNEYYGLDAEGDPFPTEDESGAEDDYIWDAE